MRKLNSNTTQSCTALVLSVILWLRQSTFPVIYLKCLFTRKSKEGFAFLHNSNQMLSQLCHAAGGIFSVWVVVGGLSSLNLTELHYVSSLVDVWTKGVRISSNCHWGDQMLYFLLTNVFWTETYDKHTYKWQHCFGNWLQHACFSQWN